MSVAKTHHLLPSWRPPHRVPSTRWGNKNTSQSRARRPRRDAQNAGDTISTAVGGRFRAAVASALPSAAGSSRTAGDGFLRVFAIFTFGYPLLWLTGLGGLYWVIIGVSSVIYLVRVRPLRALWPLLVVMAALVLSIPIGLLAFGVDFGRIASVGGNLLVWVGVAGLINLALSQDISRLVRQGIVVIGAAQGLLVFLSVLIYPQVLPVPLLQVLTRILPTGIAAFAANRLYAPDWLGEIAFRSAGLMAQPTWAGGFGAITCLVAVTFWRERTVWRAIAVVALLAGLLSVQLSLSRATQLALVASVLVGLLVATRRRSPLAFYTLAVSLLAIAIAIALGWNEQIALLLEKVNDQRQGSLSSRSEIYARTWELVRQLPFPLLGYGIKPQEADLVASVATHSSFLGMLFRGGVVGLLGLVALFIGSIRRAVLRANGYAAALAVFLTLWSILEDFDPGHLLPLGLVLSFALTAGQAAPVSFGAPWLRGTLERPAVLPVRSRTSGW